MIFLLQIPISLFYIVLGIGSESLNYEIEFFDNSSLWSGEKFLQKVKLRCGWEEKKRLKPRGAPVAIHSCKMQNFSKNPKLVIRPWEN